MALTPYGNEGALNGTTDVVVGAAPGASVQRTITNVSGHQKDSAQRILTLFKKKGASTYTIGKLTVPSGNNFTLVGKNGLAEQVVLDATDETLEVDMDAAPATTNPDWQTAGLDKS